MVDRIVRRERIEEHRLDGKPLGRHIHHDERSRRFAAEQAPHIINVKHTAYGLPFNQTVGSCTAEALTGACNTAPNYKGLFHKGMPRTQADAMACYGRETADEGQPYPPNDPGGSGLAVCKAGVEMGWIQSYTHAFGLKHLLQALVLRPTLIGINWYDSMDQPNSSGLVTVTPGASIRGGHEIFADEIDTIRKLIWFWNSWGRSFGIGGRFGMSWATVDRLLSEDGDVTVPIVKLPAHLGQAADHRIAAVR